MRVERPRLKTWDIVIMVCVCESRDGVETGKGKGKGKKEREREGEGKKNLEVLKNSTRKKKNWEARNCDWWRGAKGQKIEKTNDRGMVFTHDA